MCIGVALQPQEARHSEALQGIRTFKMLAVGVVVSGRIDKVYCPLKVFKRGNKVLTGELELSRRKKSSG